MAITLTVTAKGQITLRKQVLDHLGVRPGDQLEIELLAGGDLRLRPPAKPPVSSLFGILKRTAAEPISVEEINRATAEGWAGEQ